MDSLFRAISSGAVQDVASLLAKGVDVNTKDSKGNTPMMQLCSQPRENIEMAQILLQRNPNLMVQDPNTGWTALHWACYKKHFSISALLLRHGACCRAESKFGQTPLRVHGLSEKERDGLQRIIDSLQDGNEEAIDGILAEFHSSAAAPISQNGSVLAAQHTRSVGVGKEDKDSSGATVDHPTITVSVAKDGDSSATLPFRTAAAGAGQQAATAVSSPHQQTAVNSATASPEAASNSPPLSPLSPLSSAPFTDSSTSIFSPLPEPPRSTGASSTSIGVSVSVSVPQTTTVSRKDSIDWQQMQQIADKLNCTIPIGLRSTASNNDACDNDVNKLRAEWDEARQELEDRIQQAQEDRELLRSYFDRQVAAERTRAAVQLQQALQQAEEQARKDQELLMGTFEQQLANEKMRAALELQQAVQRAVEQASQSNCTSPHGGIPTRNSGSDVDNDVEMLRAERDNAIAKISELMDRIKQLENEAAQQQR